MRIGVNCFLLHAEIGGLKQYFFNLFDELLSSDGENSYVFFYFRHNVDELSNLENKRWQENGILIDDQRQIKRHLDGIDLYFCPFGSLWPRPLPIPSVVTLVDIQEIFYPEHFSDTELRSRAYHYVGSTRMADRVITISNFSKEAIVKYHRISPEKVFVAHLSADKRFYRADEVAQRPMNFLPAEDFIIYPANRWRHKNHDTLLKGLRWLETKRGLKIKAVFTGHDVPNCYPLAQKALEYGLDGQVCSLGYVTVEELAYLYLKARLMVFPSLFEGFGIPLVEAMAAGCPVATSNVTSLPEVGGRAVEYFDPSSHESIGMAIEKTWCDTFRRNELIKRGRSRAEDFSATKLAQNHLRAFREAAELFSRRRYVWHKWVYQHYHRGLTYIRHKGKRPS